MNINYILKVKQPHQLKTDEAALKRMVIYLTIILAVDLPVLLSTFNK